MSKKITVAGIGELLWDVVGKNEQLGGAPINFAYHINSLGGCGIPITTVGDDKRGGRALAELSARGLDTSCISTVPDFATGYVEVNTDENGIASYNFPLDLAWDHLMLTQRAHDVATRLDGICFGTLGQRSSAARATILTFLDSLPPQVLRICDLNLRQRFYSEEIIAQSLSRIHILKLSDEELQVVAAMLALSGSVETMLRELLDRYLMLDLVILTRGAQGCLLISSDDVVVDLPGIPVTVVDTIGAGDSFTAAVSLGRLLDLPLQTIADHANRLASHVCSCRGAMPPLPERLRIIK